MVVALFFFANKLSLNELLFWVFLFILAFLINIFVNYNYNKINSIIEILKSRDVVIVCSKRADIVKAPFKIKKSFRCSDNVMSDLHIVDELKRYIERGCIKNHVFLFGHNAS